MKTIEQLHCQQVLRIWDWMFTPLFSKNSFSATIHHWARKCRKNY